MLPTERSIELKAEPNTALQTESKSFPMRTYDKLIATISSRQGAEDLRARLGGWWGGCPSGHRLALTQDLTHPTP